jgi:hypothetical protein
VRLFKRKSQEPRQVPCPNCSELVPADAVECTACGWDMRELPPHRVAAGDSSEDDR